jgi:hypothetical protein
MVISIIIYNLISMKNKKKSTCLLLFLFHLYTVFLKRLILKRDRDRRVHKRPHKNDRKYDFSSKWQFLSILVRTLMDATVTVTLQNQKKHCIFLIKVKYP